MVFAAVAFWLNKKTLRRFSASILKSTDPMFWRLALKKSIVCILILFLGTALAAAGGLSFDEGLKLAKEQNKPMLVDFYAVWCGPCKAFDRAVKSDADIQKALEKVVLVKIDAEKGKGIDLAREYGVSAFPTYTLINGDRQTISSWQGYAKDHFLDKLDTAMADLSPASVKAQRYEDNRNLKDALALATYYGAKGDLKNALAMYRDAVKFETDPEKSYDMEIFTLLQRLHHDGEASFEELGAAAEKALKSDKVEAYAALYMGMTMASMARAKQRVEDQTHFLEMAKPFAEELKAIDAVPDMVGEYQALYRLHVGKDPSAAVAAMKETLPKDWQEKAEALNRFAWWCFENRVNLDEAETMAKKGAGLAEAGKSKAMILDTWAEIANAKGDPGRAVQIMEKAVAQEPDNDYYQKQVDRFKKLAAAAGKNGKS